MRKTITLLASIGVLTLAAILFSGSFSSAAGQAAGPSGYRVIKTVPVGGEGFWDYLTVDSEARRLYISHATHVTVMDTDTYSIVGEISDTEGVHGIALAPEFGRGYTSNGATNTVTIFDLKTLKTIGRTKTGKRPDAIVYDPASRRVFAFNGDAASATVIEAATGNVAGTIQLGGDPEFAVADGEGHIVENVTTRKGARTLALDERTHKIFLATAELGRMVKGAHWPPAKPGTFVILVVARESPLARNADPARK